MAYKGVKYSYAFEFIVPVDYSYDDKKFRIVISEFRPETHDYSGLCLENELKVFSNEKVPFQAFFDIVNDIIDFTTMDDKNYANTHFGNLPTSLMTVEDPIFIGQFEEKKKYGNSLQYYEQLREYEHLIGYYRKPEKIMEELPEETKFTLCDYPVILLFCSLIRYSNFKIKKGIYFRA